jgi:hypothetical protein
MYQKTFFLTEKNCKEPNARILAAYIFRNFLLFPTVLARSLVSSISQSLGGSRGTIFLTLRCVHIQFDCDIFQIAYDSIRQKSIVSRVEDTAQLQNLDRKQEGHKKLLCLTVIRIRTRILKLFGLPDTDSLLFLWVQSQHPPTQWNSLFLWVRIWNHRVRYCLYDSGSGSGSFLQ